MFSLVNDDIRITKEITSQIHLSHHILDVKSCYFQMQTHTRTFSSSIISTFTTSINSLASTLPSSPSINSTFTAQHQLYLHSPASTLPSQPSINSTFTAQHQLYLHGPASTLPSQPSINSTFTAQHQLYLHNQHQQPNINSSSQPASAA